MIRHSPAERFLIHLITEPTTKNVEVVIAKADDRGWVIDFFGLTESEAQAACPALFDH